MEGNKLELFLKENDDVYSRICRLLKTLKISNKKDEEIIPLMICCICDNNVYYTKNDRLLKDLGHTRTALYHARKTAIKHNIMVKSLNGVYMVNPEYYYADNGTLTRDEQINIYSQIKEREKFMHEAEVIINILKNEILDLEDYFIEHSKY